VLAVLTRLSKFSRHYNKWSIDTWQIGSEFNCYDKTPQKDHNAKYCKMSCADCPSLTSTATNDEKTLDKLKVSLIVRKKPNKLKMLKYCKMSWPDPPSLVGTTTNNKNHLTNCWWIKLIGYKGKMLNEPMPFLKKYLEETVWV
jgi:hypothetical protein